MGLLHAELCRGLQAVRREVPLARDEDVVTVGLRQHARLRLDDDRAVHAVGDVHQDRLGAAVIHEHAGVVGAKAVADRLAREDVAERLVGAIRAAWKSTECGIAPLFVSVILTSWP